MSKLGKRRLCPVAGREISPAECGEHRGSRYACPADCHFSPLAPANYDQLLELEGTVDWKTMERLFTTAPSREARQAAARAAGRSDSGHALHALFTHRIFFHKEVPGCTCAQGSERAGFHGLKNDERVLDAERIEAVDLLAEAAGGS